MSLLQPKTGPFIKVLNYKHDAVFVVLLFEMLKSLRFIPSLTYNSIFT